MEVIKAKNGMFIRNHENFGAIFYAPMTGLIFAVDEKYAQDSIDYCNGIHKTLPKEIINHLNNKEQTNFYLPTDIDFPKSNKLPQYPLIANWLISSICNFNCSYCYASDVMNREYSDYSLEEVAEKAIDSGVLAVVLSGGEPLLNRTQLIRAIKYLGNRVGIILDTNGYIWDKEVSELLKKYNAIVRISMDTINENDYQANRDPEKTKDSVSTINLLRDNIQKYKEYCPVVIHSVVTTASFKSFQGLETVINAMNVDGWRLICPSMPNNKDKIESFKRVMLKKQRNSNDLSRKISDIKERISNYKTKELRDSFFIQKTIESSSSRNAVFLILPDGLFATEHCYDKKKIIVNIDKIFDEINIWTHYNRYIKRKS